MSEITTTGLSPSVYGAEGAMLDLANHFLEPDSYSTLKSGFLGYVTGAMARVAAEGAYHRNVLWKENFLNTMSLPRSIYNYAKIYEYPVNMASPSSCRILFGMFLDDIRTAIGAESGRLVIERGQQVVMDGVPFVLAGRVVLDVLDQGRISANYDASEMDFPLAGNTTYIRTYSLPQPTGSGGEVRTLIYMELYAHQATARRSEFRVVSSNVVESTYFKVNVPDGEHLCGFTVRYRGSADSEWTDLPAYFNESVIPDDPMYCFYSFTDEQELEIYFPSVANGFRPAYNSALRVDFLTTTGSAGNFQFSGIPTAVIGSIQRPIPVVVELVTHPAGGRDMETLMEVKKGILNKILLRRNIVIERDLVDYLQVSVDKTRVNDSRVSFIKRRDDIQKRLFSAFLLVRDSAGRVVPTNTAAIDLEVADLESRGRALPPGTLVMYDRRNQIYRLLGPGEYPDRMANDVNSFLYCVPYLMAFRMRPFPRLVYYRNAVAEDATLNTTPGEVATADSFLANSVTVRRVSSMEDSYQIDVAVSSNLGNDALHSKCLMLLRLADAAGNELGYLEASHVSGTNIFRGAVFTDDAFDDESRLILRDSLWRVGESAVRSGVPIPEDVRINIELLYNTEDQNASAGSITRGGQTFHIVRRFSTVDFVKFYESLEQVMYGNMHVTSAGTFHCEGVPLVGASFFLNPQEGQEITKIIGSYHTAIRDVFDLLHNNTSVDVKLYRTYGPSSTFSVDRTNISLALDVHPRGRATEELRKRVVDETVAFVVECNDKDRARFSVSNLLARLESRIPDIAYIRFVGLNGSAAQNAQIAFSDAYLEQDNKRVPEFINVATIVRSSLDSDPYVPDVTVRFI